MGAASFLVEHSGATALVWVEVQNNDARHSIVASCRWTGVRLHMSERHPPAGVAAIRGSIPATPACGCRSDMCKRLAFHLPLATIEDRSGVSRFCTATTLKPLRLNAQLKTRLPPCNPSVTWWPERRTIVVGRGRLDSIVSREPQRAIVIWSFFVSSSYRGGSGGPVPTRHPVTDAMRRCCLCLSRKRGTADDGGVNSGD